MVSFPILRKKEYELRWKSIEVTGHSSEAAHTAAEVYVRDGWMIQGRPYMRKPREWVVEIGRIVVE